MRHDHEHVVSPCLCPPGGLVSKQRASIEESGIIVLWNLMVTRRPNSASSSRSMRRSDGSACNFAHSTRLRQNIRNYQGQLQELHKQHSSGTNLPPDEIQTRIAAVAQQVWDAEIDLHELCFEFTDLTAQFQPLRRTPLP